MTNQKRYTGKVRRVMPKGFGFLEPDPGQGVAPEEIRRGVFFHAQDMGPGEFERAKPGGEVSFALEETEKGLRARQVLLVRTLHELNGAGHSVDAPARRRTR